MCAEGRTALAVWLANLAKSGAGANNVLNGGDCDDIIDGRGGADTLIGGAGNDTLIVSIDAQWPHAGATVAINVGSPGLAGSGEQVKLGGRNRSFDIFNGGTGIDTIVGTSGADALILDDSHSLPGGGAPRIVDVEVIRMGDGEDIVDLTSGRFALGDIKLEVKNLRCCIGFRLRLITHSA